MRNITFDFSNMHEHGQAYYNFLRLRKHFFVDGLGWDIPHNDQVEMDQYDTPQAIYSLVMDGDRVLGGARVAPTSAHWGDYTYMIGDANAGKLSGMPKHQLGQTTRTNRVWECTRLVISEDVATLADRNYCLGLIVDGLVKEAQAGGAHEMICLSFVTLQRALRRLGHAVRRIGDPYVNDSDGRTYVVLAMPALRARQELEAARPAWIAPMDEPEDAKAAPTSQVIPINTVRG